MIGRNEDNKRKRATNLNLDVFTEGKALIKRQGKEIRS